MELIYNDDCIEFLKMQQENKFDSLITDPPAGISFMSKKWDDDKGGRDQWIEWMAGVMQECLRVLKPGAHGLVWAIPRTSHWTATALENAGFEIRDVVTHLFGQGFPKSSNISKQLDKMAGAKREVIGTADRYKDGRTRNVSGPKGNMLGNNANGVAEITAPSTPEAKQYNGCGTNLKPAAEFWILVRKPISERTIAANVLRWGTGGINIDGCRIGVEGKDSEKFAKEWDRDSIEDIRGGNYAGGGVGKSGKMKNSIKAPSGRFPANLVLSHHPECKKVGTKEVKTSQLLKSHKLNQSENNCMSGKNYSRNPNRDYGKKGKETVENWKCHAECPVGMLDEQSGELKSGKRDPGGSPYGVLTTGKCGAKRSGNDASIGGASRFFYCAKSSKKDRGEGNSHPTVKSTKLMEYLIKLITPPNGIVLDPFMGSGSTGVSAKNLGFDFCGIERDESYYKISENRMSL